MTDNSEPTLHPANEAAVPNAADGVNSHNTPEQHREATPPFVETPFRRRRAILPRIPTAPTAQRRWAGAEAGRKGGRHVHQLIQEGKLYEQEHGLKSGRQRLRQLLELGKLYEEEHGLRPAQGAAGTSFPHGARGAAGHTASMPNSHRQAVVPNGTRAAGPGMREGPKDHAA